MKKQFVRLALAAVTLAAPPALLSPYVFAQAISVNGGSIQGTITDPSGALVSGAAISITSPETGYKHDLVTDKSGFYSIGPLNPGNYTVTVTSTGFQTLSVQTVVRTGTSTPGSFKLSVGQSSTEISVTAGQVQLNTDQGGVSDVITKAQIDSLPINGRNFLDLAQIEPGVILQSGETFDPTKAGYSAISVSGVSGRTTRILLDGQDITDETVGTTIFNVSQGAINEFQLNRSTQDVSGELTSTGQVLVSTNSGTNGIHGQLSASSRITAHCSRVRRTAMTLPSSGTSTAAASAAPSSKTSCSSSAMPSVSSRIRRPRLRLGRCSTARSDKPIRWFPRPTVRPTPPFASTTTDPLAATTLFAQTTT